MTSFKVVIKCLQEMVSDRIATTSQSVLSSLSYNLLCPIFENQSQLENASHRPKAMNLPSVSTINVLSAAAVNYVWSPTNWSNTFLSTPPPPLPLPHTLQAWILEPQVGNHSFNWSSSLGRLRQFCCCWWHLIHWQISNVSHQDGQIDADELQRCLTSSGIAGTYQRKI